MALYKGFVVSNGERQVLNILEQYTGIIKVVPKIRFFDVVEWNSKMEYNEHSYLEKTHLDFMVCENKMPYRFLFAIKLYAIKSIHTIFTSTKWLIRSNCCSNTSYYHIRDYS